MKYLEILNSYFKSSTIPVSKYIVYLDMDGVLANFDKGKEDFILNEIRDELIDLIDNPYLNEMEINTILEELTEDSKTISLIGSKKFKDLRDYSWEQWVKKRKFETLETIEDSSLIQGIHELKLEYNFKIGILSSTGTEKSYKNVSAQKYKWLDKNRLLQYLNLSYITFVSDAKYKKSYAFSNTILIDDLEINCDQFIDNGGKAILHNKNNQVSSIQNTINSLKKILQIN